MKMNQKKMRKGTTKMKMTLNTLFDFNTKGIFGYLDAYDVPWKLAVPSNLLDLDYHTTHGDKVISKTVSALLEPSGLSDENKQKLAHLIYAKNSVKWNKLWDTLGLYDKFNVLDNTDWEETITHEHEGLDIRDLNYGKQKQTFNKGEQNNEVNQGQQSLTQGAQTNKTGAQINSVENKTSAFNSNSYQPDNSQNQNLGQREDSVGQRVDTVGAKIDTSKDGARQDVRENDAYADKDTLDTFFKDTLSTKRHGNIGVTTSGQLIDDFRKLVDWTIFDTVFEDINAILVLDFFGDCDSDLDDYTIETNYVLPTATANRLGGIKVGHNLSVEADGTLNAQAEAGDVQSVNGKTGVVVLTNEDVNAPSIEAFNNLAASKQDKIVTEGFENGTFYGIWNGEASFREVMQVPGYDGQKGQVLTKGDGVRYEWKDSVGGVIKPEPLTIIKASIANTDDNTNFTIYDQSSINNMETAVFDVSNFVGCDYEFSALSKYWYNSDNATGPNRMRAAFVDDTFNPLIPITGDITITKEHGCFVGIRSIEEQTNPWNVGNIKVPAYSAAYGVYRFWGNTISGIIPMGSKYFLAYISNHWDDAKVRNGLVYDFRIFK